MIFGAQGVEPLDYKIIIAAFAIVVLAFKVVLDVLRWRRESGQRQPQATLEKLLEGVHAIRETLNREHPLTGQKLIYMPRDLEQRLEMLREIRAQNGEIMRLLDDVSNRLANWGGPTGG
jgi:hypothetical protein